MCSILATDDLAGLFSADGPTGGVREGLEFGAYGPLAVSKHQYRNIGPPKP